MVESKLRSNISFNASGIRLIVIENLDAIPDSSRRVNSGVRLLAFHILYSQKYETMYLHNFTLYLVTNDKLQRHHFSSGK
jgi:hypothetical protein